MKNKRIGRALVACALGLCWAAPTSAAVISATANPNVIIPDNSFFGVTSTVSFGTSAIINSLEVTVGVSHTYVGDLQYNLTKDDTTIILMRPSGSADLSATAPLTFSDSASAPASTIGSGCSGALVIGISSNCLTTFFLPVEALSIFSGRDVFGEWNLFVRDRVSGDTGVLASWTLTAYVDVVSVPEPGTLALLGLGLVGMGLRRRVKAS